jgi:hypothetical protein
MYLQGFDLVNHPNFPRLAEWILVLPQVFFSQGIDVRVRTLLGDLYDFALHRQITVWVFRVL